MSQAPILSLRGVVKRFGGVTALGGVDFDLRPGEVHALCGENGAGKSTLIKLLAGVHPHGSFSGSYQIDGREAGLRSLRDGTAAGIGVIYQELVLVDEMSIAENLFLGDEPRRGPLGLLVDHGRMCREARALLGRFGLAIDPARPVGSLGVGGKQLLEIVKALRRRSRVLILDEPTAALTEREAELLLSRLRELRRAGVACIYISHKLDEVQAIADRITVLRDGKSVYSAAAAATSPEALIRHMVGREISALFPPRRPSAPATSSSSSSWADGAPLLVLRELSVAPRPGAPPRLRDVSFRVHAGEVVGVYGLLGAGRSELLLHLCGAWGVRTGGSVSLGGEPLAARSPAEAMARGLVLVSEERRRFGLVMDGSIRENLSLASLAAVAHRGLIDGRAEYRRDLAMARRLRIKIGWRGLETPASALSGGNQQKVVLGKALLCSPRVILLDEPTRGVDVGAKQEIYELVRELCAAGLGVVLVSSELPELLGLADRVVVLGGGAMRAELDAEQATPEALLGAALLTAPARADSLRSA
ncbi:MAG: sugar ABC transporter ATP-binding protein [Polyangia bacterium]